MAANAPLGSVAVAMLLASLAMSGCMDGNPPEAEVPAAPHPWRLPGGIHAVSTGEGDARQTGLLGVPPSGTTTGLIIIAKGLLDDAADLPFFFDLWLPRGAIVLIMDYHEPPPAWAITSGAEALVAGTLALQAAFPEAPRTILFGYSLGSATAGAAALAAPPGTYTHLVLGGGISDLAWAWDEHPNQRSAIEHEAGGTPATAPDAYVQRSTAKRAPDLAALGIGRVHLVHAAGDTLVLARHSDALFDALAAAGQPTTYYTVTVTWAPWVCAPVADLCLFNTLPVGPANHEQALVGVTDSVMRRLLQGHDGFDDPTRRYLTDYVVGEQVPVPLPPSLDV